MKLVSTVNLTSWRRADVRRETRNTRTVFRIIISLSQTSYPPPFTRFVVVLGMEYRQPSGATGWLWWWRLEVGVGWRLEAIIALSWLSQSLSCSAVCITGWHCRVVLHCKCFHGLIPTVCACLLVCACTMSRIIENSSKRGENRKNMSAGSPRVRHTCYIVWFGMWSGLKCLEEVVGILR